MDVARVCYSHKVYWDDAKTLSSIIIWYRASQNALPFPFPHVFSMEVYDTVHWYNPGAGEDQLSGRTYYNGVPPARFTGQTFCGPPEWYLGAPSDAPPLQLDADGWPVPCQVEAGYGYTVPSAQPPPPPSGPACPGCEGGIAPSVFKATIHMATPQAFCQAFTGTFEVPAGPAECEWTLTFSVSGVQHTLQIRLLPGFQGCLLDGITYFLPPALPMDCFAVQSWSNVGSSDPCASAFNSMTTQPG